MKICELVVEYLHYLTNVRNYAVTTVNNYTSDLHIFTDFCKDDLNIENISDIKDTDIIKFIAFTKNVLHNSSYAVARKLRCLRSLFRYALERNYLEISPTAAIREPKIAKRLPIYLTIDEAQRFLSVIDGKYKARDYAMIMIFLFCGLRVSELSNIDISDLDLISDTITVIGKGNKQRLIPLNAMVNAAICDYLNVRPPTGETALFLSYRKTRLTVRGIQKLIKKYADLSDISKKISPHKLRHTCATLLYEEGSLLELQKLLGHESVATTQIYAHTNAEQLKKLTDSNPLLKRLK